MVRRELESKMLRGEVVRTYHRELTPISQQGCTWVTCPGRLNTCLRLCKWSCPYKEKLNKPQASGSIRGWTGLTSEKGMLALAMYTVDQTLIELQTCWNNNSKCQRHQEMKSSVSHTEVNGIKSKKGRPVARVCRKPFVEQRDITPILKEGQLLKNHRKQERTYSWKVHIWEKERKWTEASSFWWCHNLGLHLYPLSSLACSLLVSLSPWFSWTLSFHGTPASDSLRSGPQVAVCSGPTPLTALGQMLHCLGLIQGGIPWPPLDKQLRQVPKKGHEHSVSLWNKFIVFFFF